MADKWPLANGNWSNAANWNGGTKPVAGDDVYADGKTVTIDENVSIASVRTTARTGGTAGGGLQISGTFNVTANIICGTTSPIVCNSGCNSIITGTITPSSSLSVTTGAIRFNNGSIATVNSPSFSSGASGSPSIHIKEGNVNVSLVGNVLAGGVWFRNDSSYQTANTYLTVTGNVATDGIKSKDWRTAFTQFFTINGNIDGGGIASSESASYTVVLNGNMSTDSNGLLPFSYANQSPIKVFISPTNTLQHTYRVNNAGVPGVARSLYTGGVNLNQPATSDVRKDIVYGASNEFTGTLAVADPAYVSLGVPTDNTVGTLQ